MAMFEFRQWHDCHTSLKPHEQRMSIFFLIKTSISNVYEISWCSAMPSAIMWYKIITQLTYKNPGHCDNQLLPTLIIYNSTRQIAFNNYSYMLACILTNGYLLRDSLFINCVSYLYIIFAHVFLNLSKCNAMLFIWIEKWLKLHAF